jgi:glycosyltransferase 2 family protein
MWIRSLVNNHWWAENKINIIRWLGTILAIALIVLLLREEGGDDLVDALKRVSIWYFISGIMVMLVSRFFVVLRWHVLLRSGGVGISFQRTAMLTFTGLFSSNFLPTTIGGDVVRLAGAMQFGYDRAICLASLVADRLIGILAMATTLPFGLIPVWALGRDGLQAVTIPLLYSRGVGFLKRIFDAFAIWLKKPVPLALSFLATFGNMACIFAAVYFLIAGLDHKVSYWLIAGLWGLTYFVTLIPISVNGFGVQELSLTLLLSRIGGLSHSESLTVAILIRALFLTTSLPGAYFLPSILASMSIQRKKDS